MTPPLDKGWTQSKRTQTPFEEEILEDGTSPLIPSDPIYLPQWYFRSKLGRELLYSTPRFQHLQVYNRESGAENHQVTVDK